MAGINRLDRFVFISLFIIYISLNAQISIPGAGILRWLMLCFVLFLGAIYALYNGDDIHIIDHYLIPFLFFAFISFFYSINIKISLYKYISFILLLTCFQIFFGRKKVGAEDIKIIFDDIVLLFNIVNLFNFYFVFISGLGIDGVRYQGVFTNPNTLGIFSIISFLMNYYKSFYGKKFNMFYFVMCMFSFFMVVMSGSRSAFMVFGINLVLIYTVLSDTLRKKPNLLYILSAFGLCLYLTTSFDILVLDRIKTDGLMSRGGIWELAIDYISKRPYFGYGYGTSELLYHLFGNNYEVEAFHNSFLTITVDLGIVGFAVFIICMGFLFHEMIRDFRGIRDMRGKAFLSILLLIVVSLLIEAYSESYLFAAGSLEAIIFWMFLVMLRKMLCLQKTAECEGGCYVGQEDGW